MSLCINSIACIQVTQTHTHPYTRAGFSPLTLKGLTPGNHNISVDPVPIEGCDRDVARSITFSVP